MKRQCSVRTRHGEGGRLDAFASLSPSVDLPVWTTSSDVRLRFAFDRRALPRNDAISRTPGCDRGQRASGPASVSSVDFPCSELSVAVEIRTVCDSCRFVTSLTVLSIPAPQRVPRRREKRAPAIWAAAASADARPVRAPWCQR